MVAVSMVLAEFVKFKHGLYRSCGIECFEGIMLEPCLLQPCFHVAGRGNLTHSEGQLADSVKSLTNKIIINQKPVNYIYIYIFIYIIL